MSGNIDPIYSKVGDIQWCTVATGNAATDGTGTAPVGFTADATNGGRVDRIKVRPLGTNVQTVIRCFVNNGSTAATAANNSLIGEISMPAIAVSQVAAQTDFEFALIVPAVLPPGYRLLFSTGTTIAAGVAVTCYGGKY